MPLTIKVTGQQQLSLQSRWMASLDGILRRPEALVPAVRDAGDYFQRNFKEQGSFMGNRWQNLTEYTKRVRTEAGHGEGPILQRSGQLKNAAAYSVANWRAMGNHPLSYEKPYGEGGSLSFVGSMSPGRFHATLTGARVENQRGKQQSREQAYFGGFSGTGRYGSGYVPPRPFWYFTQPMVQHMSGPVVIYIMSEWQSASGGVASLTGIRSTVG